MLPYSYVFDIYDSYLRQAEERVLKHIDYMDGLTGLNNRVFCSKRLSELDKGEREFILISFDVDKIKEINYDRGYKAGDGLLVSFSDIIIRYFADIGDVIRSGGDEFLVISDDAARQEIESRLKWLISLEKNMEKSLGFPFSVSYGVAERGEVPGRSTEEACFLAYKRMREMKRKIKI